MTEKIIMIASSKGGVGKSTAALGIATALVRKGRKVLIADLDFANACLDILTGVQDSVLCTLQDLARERAAAKDALVRIDIPHKKAKRFSKSVPVRAGELWLLPSSVGAVDGEFFNDFSYAQNMCRGIKEASELIGADFIILDTGAGINDGTAIAATFAESALVVTGQMPVAVRAAQSTAERLLSLGVRDIRLLVNSFDAKGVLGGAHRRGLFTVIDESHIPLAGVIPYDYGLLLSHEGLAGALDAADTAFDNIASRLEGNNVPIFTGIKNLRKLKKKICL